MNIVESSRNAIIVLAMHRPDRSMLADILGHMGCELPGKTGGEISPDAVGDVAVDPVAWLNADLFAGAGFDWRRSPYFPTEWLASAAAQDLAIRARNELATAYGGSSHFTLIDPAVWPILPFWHRVLMDSGCRARHIVLHGHPATFAAFLEGEGVCDAHYAQLLWLRQMLDAEAFSRRRPRLFLSHDRLAADWKAEVARIGEELGVEWPRAANWAAWHIDQLAAAHRRPVDHDEGGEQERADLSDEVRRTLDILDDWAANGENSADHAVLDGIRAGLEDAPFAETALRRQAQWLEQHGREPDMKGAVPAPQADHDASLPPEMPGVTAQAVEDAEAPLREMIERLRDEKAELTAAIERSEKERSAAEHARDQLQSALTQRRHELEELYNREEQREALIGQLRAALDQLKAEHDELAERHDDAGKRLEQMTRRLEAQVKREGAANRERAEAEIAGQKRAEQIKALEGALETLRANQSRAIDQAREQAELDARRRERGDREKIETLTAGLQSKEAQLTSARADAVRHRGAADRALSELANVRSALETQNLRSRRESAELRQEIMRLEATRDKIKNSISWRYTAPIRKMVRAVRGRRNKK